jgi:ubiquinone/menaquinone biosynthesis C-methylase UbiE
MTSTVKSTADVRERRAYEAINALGRSGHTLDGFMLDLGSGPGHLAKVFLSKTSCNVVCVDISYERVKIAKEHVPGCHFVQCDGGRLPFRDSIFRTIVCNDVLEHTPYSNGSYLVQELDRITTGDSKIYLSAMNRWEILEPHWLLPFFTWAPRSLWDATFTLLVRFSPKVRNGAAPPRIRYSEHYFPYTRKMMTTLLKDFRTIDITDMYAREKINDPNYIGSRMARFAVKFLRGLGLSRFALAIANRLSVLVFICDKNSTSSR